MQVLSRINLKYGSTIASYCISIRLMTSRKAHFATLKSSPTLAWQHPAWPTFSFQRPELDAPLKTAELAQSKLASALTTIGYTGITAINRDLWSQDTLATAAIEGQTLDLAAVRSSVGHRLNLGDASTDRDVEGLVQMMQEATSDLAAITHERLCAWQKMIFPRNDERPAKLQVTVGRYRDHAEPMQIISGPIGRELVHYTAPPSNEVAQHMGTLIDWINTSGDEHWLIRTAITHLWFELIHPFEDGNGRVGRALADYTLARALNTTHRAFSLSHQLRIERQAYYDELHAAGHLSPTDNLIDITRWLIWFASVFTRGCEHSLAVIRASTDKAAFWQRASEHDLNARQRKVLQLLLDNALGDADALSADRYVQLTGASKATATRDLTALAAAHLLVTRGQGKATRYVLAMQ
jgi:Fic family protein